MAHWIVGFLNDVARSEVEALPDSLRASFLRIVELIEAQVSSGCASRM